MARLIGKGRLGTKAGTGIGIRRYLRDALLQLLDWPLLILPFPHVMHAPTSLAPRLGLPNFMKTCIDTEIAVISGFSSIS